MDECENRGAVIDGKKCFLAFIGAVVITASIIVLSILISIADGIIAGLTFLGLVLFAVGLVLVIVASVNA